MHIPAKAVPGRAQTSLRALQSEVRTQGCREGLTTPASELAGMFDGDESMLLHACSESEASTGSESEASRRSDEREKGVMGLLQVQ
jgi:hypothetical protein